MKIVVTGATDGLGRALVEKLFNDGHDVVLHGRDKVKIDAVMKHLGMDQKQCRSYVSNFHSLKCVSSMAVDIIKNEIKVDALINNVGVGPDASVFTTEDGFNSTFQANYISHYLLTRLMWDIVSKVVINISSDGQYPLDMDDILCYGEVRPAYVYAKSKLALTMSAIEFSLEANKSPKTEKFYSIHPASLMPTKLVVGKFPVLSKLEDGVQNVCHLLYNPSYPSGSYVNGAGLGEPNAQVQDNKVRSRLMELTKLAVRNYL